MQNTLYVFTVTVDQFNALLMNKSTHFLKNKTNVTDPKLLIGSE